MPECAIVSQNNLSRLYLPNIPSIIINRPEEPIRDKMASNLRCIYYKFKRVQLPPLRRPRESPYIVGPYLKPDYVPEDFITDSIKTKHNDHLNYFIYRPEPVYMDADRKIKLLLIEDVEGLGVAGQVVDANYRHGASRLVAMRKADYATDFSLKWHKFGPRTIQSASSALSPRTARLLESTIFDLPVSPKAAIKAWHLSLALRISGCNCPHGAIGNIETKNDGIVTCEIKINNHENVKVRFKIDKPE